MTKNMKYWDDLLKFEEEYKLAIRGAIAPIRTKFRKEAIAKGFDDEDVESVLNDVADLITKLKPDYKPLK